MADQPTPPAPAEPTNQPPVQPTEPTQPSPSDVKPVEPAKPEDKTVPLSRFSEVNAELKALKDKQAEADKKALEEQGKWQELAQANEAKATAAEARAREAHINNSVLIEASKLGIVDPDAASKLLNRSNVLVADDGTVTGVDAALQQLVTDKPYLVAKETATRIGSGSSPGADGNQSPTDTIFKKSQYQDTAFYRANEKEMDKALKEGRIIDDTIQK